MRRQRDRRRHRHRRHGRRRGRRLRRQIFFAFGIAIGAAVLTVGAVTKLAGGSSWQRELGRAELFIESRYQAAWRDPAARAELTASLARELEVGVVVLDEDGAVVERAGATEPCRKRRDVGVEDFGNVQLCLDARDGGGGRLRGIAMVVGPLAVLWMLAGLWARRLARPLMELTEVARDLGAGRLDRRSELPHVGGEVGELAAAMNEMAGNLEAKIKAERELLATVSHELRTPLSRVRLLCELGRGGSGRDVLGEVEREAVEMEAMVADLLAAARLDFKALAARPIDVVALARESLAALAERTGRRVALEAPESLTVSADPTLLARALAILLDNAERHGGGATTLRLLTRDGRVMIEVEDAGPGFAPDVLAHVFEPFRVGLGLSLVRRIAEAHGGTAHAANLAHGARVTLDIGDRI